MRLASESHDNEDNMNRHFGVFGQGAASFLLLCSCVFAQDRTNVLFTAADESITPNIVFLMADELENTIVVMSGDNGLPFPRCKATLYDTGTHVPLAIRWGAKIKGGRSVTDFTSLTDLAPTFLEAAGLTPPAEMTGRSLLSILTSEKSGQVDVGRTSVLVGMERHVDPQPARAIRTAEFLYIRNFDLEKWPNIDSAAPYPKIDYKNGEWLADAKAFPLNMDQSPTLQFLLDHRNDPAVKPHYELATGSRPEEELYDVKADAAERRNIADDPRFGRTKAELRAKLEAELRALGDPRFANTGALRTTTNPSPQ